MCVCVKVSIYIYIYIALKRFQLPSLLDTECTDIFL